MTALYIALAFICGALFARAFMRPKVSPADIEKIAAILREGFRAGEPTCLED